MKAASSLASRADAVGVAVDGGGLRDQHYQEALKQLCFTLGRNMNNAKAGKQKSSVVTISSHAHVAYQQQRSWLENEVTKSARLLCLPGAAQDSLPAFVMHSSSIEVHYITDLPALTAAFERLAAQS